MTYLWPTHQPGFHTEYPPPIVPVIDTIALQHSQCSFLQDLQINVIMKELNLEIISSTNDSKLVYLTRDNLTPFQKKDVITNDKS